MEKRKRRREGSQFHWKTLNHSHELIDATHQSKKVTWVEKGQHGGGGVDLAQIC